MLFFTNILSQILTANNKQKLGPQKLYSLEEHHSQEFKITKHTIIDVPQNVNIILNSIIPVFCSKRDQCEKLDNFLDILKIHIELNGKIGTTTEETKKLPLILRKKEVFLAEIIFFLQSRQFDTALKSLTMVFREFTSNLRQATVLKNVENEKILLLFRDWLEFYMHNKMTIDKFTTENIPYY